ncbi:hypothetical protein Pst134EA_019436 [Puccinia striiformis f. sp. tritici]|uniref:hypothetical protein n=1 Tax=Puccinia striiformis f. sp. tritici TaxID=168172 RepID=UPI002007BECD|nr:hypothetical protein Pst134EA_019436 [Puccinia striiformis f. sp. tritici]KAH9459281.1 hypothetical protein Pst134EA_019436 [Puccinia striiformis f. sp. tritici]
MSPTGVDPSAKPPRLMVHLRCNGIILLCLVDTGAEINLMRQAMAEKINLPLHTLAHPTTVNLAMDNGSTKPIILRHYIATTLVDPSTSHAFQDIALKLGPMKGPYDLILGTPFLARYNINVSIATRSLKCEPDGPQILDYRLLDTKPVTISAVSLKPPTPYPCETSESLIFSEFKELFFQSSTKQTLSSKPECEKQTSCSPL